jgi:redox-sensing transcriptional repressor
VAVVGAGRVGTALFSYEGFARQGFDVVAVFDADAGRVGHRHGSLVVEHVQQLPAIVAERGVEIGVVATPAGAAQQVADALVAAGVRGILNFAPCKLRVPPEVSLRAVDMAVDLESLAFALANARGRRRGRRAPVSS